MQLVSRVGTRAKLEIERARARYRVLDVAIGTFKRYSQDDGGFYAASLTYYMFFSIFPVLLGATAVLGFFLDAELRQRLITSGVRAIPMLGEILTSETLRTIEQNAGTLALVSIVLALYSGSGGVTALMHALNRVHRIEHERNFLAQRLISLKWFGFMVIAAVLSLGPSALAALASREEGIGWELVGALGHVLAAILTTAAFAFTFRFLPNTDLEWSDVLPGSAIAAVVFEVLKMVGENYLTSGAEGRNATFGAFAAAATLLVVSYLLAQVVLLGAELNAVLAERRKTRESSSTSENDPDSPLAGGDDLQSEDKEGP